MDEQKEHIFNQLKIYSEQLSIWETMILMDTCKPGETGKVKDDIKKTKGLIDALLDRYNKIKNLCPCP